MTLHKSTPNQTPGAPAATGGAERGGASTKLPNGKTLPKTGYDAQRSAVSPAAKPKADAGAKKAPGNKPPAKNVLGGAGETVTTLGGTFTRERFVKHPGELGGDERWGAEMDLSFLSSEGVDCTKIALVQTVNCKRKLKAETEKAPYYGGSDKRSERATATGTNIDREEGYDDPAFGVGNPELAAAETAALREALRVGDDSNKAQGTVEKGHVGGRKGRHATKSTLEDRSMLGWKEGDQIDTTFEAAAVGREGTLTGVYLGTVGWGYSVSATGDIALSGLTLISAGTPTAEFGEASKSWNEQSYTHERYFSPDEAVADGYLSKHKTENPGDSKVSVDVDNDDIPLTSRGTVGTAPTAEALTGLKTDLDAIDARKTAGTSLDTDVVDGANLKFQIARYAKLLPPSTD